MREVPVASAEGDGCTAKQAARLSSKAGLKAGDPFSLLNERNSGFASFESSIP